MDSRKLNFLIAVQREIDKLEEREGDSKKVEKLKSKFYDLVELENINPDANAINQSQNLMIDQKNNLRIGNIIKSDSINQISVSGNSVKSDSVKERQFEIYNKDIEVLEAHYLRGEIVDDEDHFDALTTFYLLKDLGFNTEGDKKILIPVLRDLLEEYKISDLNLDVKFADWLLNKDKYTNKKGTGQKLIEPQEFGDEILNAIDLLEDELGNTKDQIDKQGNADELTHNPLETVEALKYFTIEGSNLKLLVHENEVENIEKVFKLAQKEFKKIESKIPETLRAKIIKELIIPYQKEFIPYWKENDILPFSKGDYMNKILNFKKYYRFGSDKHQETDLKSFFNELTFNPFEAIKPLISPSNWNNNFRAKRIEKNLGRFKISFDDVQGFTCFNDVQQILLGIIDLIINCFNYPVTTSDIDLISVKCKLFNFVENPHYELEIVHNGSRIIKDVNLFRNRIKNNEGDFGRIRLEKFLSRCDWSIISLFGDNKWYELKLLDCKNQLLNNIEVIDIDESSRPSKWAFIHKLKFYL